jgi:hypothetical protein
MRLRCPRVVWLLGFVLLVGLSACGSPPLEAPQSGSTSGSAAAVGSLSVGDTPRAAAAPARQAPTPTSPLGPPAQQAATAAERRSPNAPSPADSQPSDAQTPADQAQREARQQRIAELGASPDATVRLQALALWAAQPGAALDPALYAFLEDDDEQVRARAEALWEEQLTREEEASVP